MTLLGIRLSGWKTGLNKIIKTRSRVSFQKLLGELSDKGLIIRKTKLVPRQRSILELQKKISTYFYIFVFVILCGLEAFSGIAIWK